MEKTLLARACAAGTAVAARAMLVAMLFSAPALSNTAPVSQSTMDACATLVSRNAILVSGKLESTRNASGSVCVLRGRILSSPSSTINFRLDLPDARDWNSRLMTLGGGGFDGFIPGDVLGPKPYADILGTDAERLKGYATVSSDAGHQGRGILPYADFSWVSKNPTALRNHAYEAHHTVLVVATDLVRQYYGKPPTRRYLMGASNGGRAGLIAIQRYPLDYDGVLSIAPAISQGAFAANQVPELFRHIFTLPEHWMNAEQIALFEKTELDACDALDGLEDGIVGNVKACHYTGADLACRPGEPASNTCLTLGQLETIRRIYSDKHVPVALADGIVGYPAYGRGGQSSDWVAFLFGPAFASRTALDFVFADNIVKWGITGDPNATLMTHDPTKWAAEYQALSAEIDATNPDLSAFYQHGGKLIVYHGVADVCVSYLRTAEYLSAVQTKLGAQATAQFMRYYIAPGTGHVNGGPGAIKAPLLSALEEWVEKRHVPGVLIASLSTQPGGGVRTRPLCQYPTFPRYKGKGDPNSAESFGCSDR